MSIIKDITNKSCCLFGNLLRDQGECWNYLPNDSSCSAHLGSPALLVILITVNLLNPEVKPDLKPEMEPAPRSANRPRPTPAPTRRRLAHLLVDRLSAISVTGASEV